MSALAEATGVDRLEPGDVRRAARAEGLLAAFNAAGVLHSADVHVATTLGRLGGEPNERVLLAVALAVRAVRLGSVCIDLRAAPATAAADPEQAADLDRLPWPDVEEWYAECAASPLVAAALAPVVDRPVRLSGELLYLDRYWQQEQLVRAVMEERAARTPPDVEPTRLQAALEAVFGTGEEPDYQRLAAAAAATGWVTLIAGGPGTGKTTTVARLLAVLAGVSEAPPRVALAAPTGKAAARLQEAVAAQSARLAAAGVAVAPPLGASTLHRLLGYRPGPRSGFRHDRSNRLPYDVVVVDETSMVSLTLMSRLLEALRPDARLVLVGDPDQLASVEAGAVLGDLVYRERPTGPVPRLAAMSAVAAPELRSAYDVEGELTNDVVRLRTNFRYGGRIGDLAEAIRAERPDDVVTVLRSGAADVEFVEVEAIEERVPAGLDALRADVETAGQRLVVAARSSAVAAALTALDAHRLLCAHRRGPYGVARWGAVVEGWLAAAIDGYAEGGEWHPGRPLLVTANDYALKLWNGDTGVVLAGAAGPVAAFTRGTEPLLLPPSRLPAVQTVHAMTVHRSQGSQFAKVSVLLPPEDSPLLTRELLYTAVTRAQHQVRVIGSEAAVRAAVGRPITRASGLRRRVVD